VKETTIKRQRNVNEV